MNATSNTPTARLWAGVVAGLLLGALLMPPAGAQDRFPAQRLVFSENDPIGAAIELSQAHWDDGTAPSVFLGREDNFADNLAATPLTTLGPLLYVQGGPDGQLRGDVLTEIQRAHPVGFGGCGGEFGDDITIMGGPNAVSDNIVATLEAEGYCVGRLFGGSRVETSIAAARTLITDGRDTLVVARSNDWADAATGGAWARANGVPIVVTQTDSLHPAVFGFLSEMPFETIILLGGTAALSESVESDLRSFANTVVRVAGPTRDTTAIQMIADLWSGNDDTGERGVALVPGFDALGWTYAFAGAATGQPQLYTQPDVLTGSTAEELRNGWFDYRALSILGPPGAISDAVASDAEDAVNE